MVRRCSKCRQVKSVQDFHRWNRGGGFQPWCKACRRVYDAEYHRLNRTRRKKQKQLWHAGFLAWYRSLKEGRPCSDCDQIFEPEAMHWDHREGTQKQHNVADLGRRWNKARVLAEVEKCDLVCANCHAARTVHRRNGA
jgi:hypothetical protein